MSGREIAKNLGVGKTAVHRWAKELGFQFTKYSVNEDFFDRWSETSAYVLGFIFADGNVAWNLKKCYWALTITAAEKDRTHLERIRRLMKITKPLLYSNKTKSYRMIISNKPLCSKLIKLGVVPRKSLIVAFPEIPEPFLRHFLRGVIDGDGWVRYNDRKRSPYLEIGVSSGSPRFCESLTKAVYANYGIYSKPRLLNGNTFVVSYTCTRAQKLAELIYLNATIFLKRKFK